MPSASDLKLTLIDEFKKEGGKFERYILSVDESISNNHELIGVDDYKSVKQNWAKIKNKQAVYLDNYHTSPDLAYVLKILLPNIKFDNNHTEFVYIGFEDESDASFRWCFTCGYTEDNLNVSASFIDLESETERQKPIVLNIVNTSQIIKDTTTQETSPKISFSYSEFPDFFLQNDERIAVTVKCKNLISLAEKWEIASEIWHSNEEASMMKDFFEQHIDSNSKILDAACGTGQHFFVLNSMNAVGKNYTLYASDKDEENLRIFTSKAAELGISVTPQIADWSKLTTDLNNEKFDIINCLGTSIPYYMSWKENGNGYEFTKEKLKSVLVEFKKSLNPNGKLIIGLSRHISKNLKGTFLEFQPKTITNSKVDIPNGDYEMTWQFKYDWSEQRKRIWNCHIKNKFGDDYSFKLVSHLFDIEELKSFCAEVFDEKNVEIVDVNSMSYDMFVICKNE